MSRLVKTILSLKAGEPAGGHPSDEDLARLADGLVDGDERRGLISHVNRCDRCTRVLSGTMTDLREIGAGDQSWWSRNSRQFISVAASVIMVVLIGGGLYQYQTGQRADEVEMTQAVMESRKQEADAPPPDAGSSRAVAKEAPAAPPRPAPAPAFAPPPRPASPAPAPAFAPPLRPATEAGRVRAKQAPKPEARPEARPEATSRVGRSAVGMQAKKAAAPKPAPTARDAEDHRVLSMAARPLPWASLPIDQALRDALALGSREEWKTDQSRAPLLAELKKRGLPVDGVRRVVMTGSDPADKDYAAAPLVLKVRIQGEVLYLQVTAATGRD